MTKSYKSKLSQEDIENLQNQCLTLIAKNIARNEAAIDLKFDELRKSLRDDLLKDLDASDMSDQIALEAALGELLMAVSLTIALHAYTSVLSIRRMQGNVVDLEYIMEVYIDLTMDDLKKTYLSKSREANQITIDHFNAKYASNFDG